MNDAIYRERAHLVAHLAAIYPSSWKDSGEPGWPLVFIDLPTGQCAWHVAEADMDLFSHVQPGSASWDGHSTEEKYQRIDEHTKAIAS